MDAFGDYEVWEYNVGPHELNVARSTVRSTLRRTPRTGSSRRPSTIWTTSKRLFVFNGAVDAVVASKTRLVDRSILLFVFVCVNSRKFGFADSLPFSEVLGSQWVRTGTR
jgi:hypothetical protein